MSGSASFCPVLMIALYGWFTSWFSIENGPVNRVKQFWLQVGLALRSTRIAPVNANLLLAFHWSWAYRPMLYNLIRTWSTFLNTWLRSELPLLMPFTNSVMELMLKVPLVLIPVV